MPELSRPTLTVIVPVRNEAEYIADCIAAILRDPIDGGIEVLVVDGMSDDGTQKVVAEIADRDPRVRLLENPDRFVPTAMNLGIAESRGQYIGRVDGHCTVLPGYLPGCLDRMRSGDFQCVGGVLISEGITPVGRAIAAAMSSPIGVGAARFRVGATEESLVDTVAFGVYRREVFSEIGCFDEELIRNQDDELNLRLVRAGGRILLVPSLRVRYFVRSTFRYLGRQYFQYGFWKARVMRKHKRPAAVRHVVPSLFILLLGILSALSVWSSPARVGLAAVLGVYGACLLAEGLRLGPKRQSPPIKTAWAMAVIHASYGTGLIAGLVSEIGKKRGSRTRHTTLSR